jgi:hypothetical protein
MPLPDRKTKNLRNTLDNVRLLNKLFYDTPAYSSAAHHPRMNLWASDRRRKKIEPRFTEAHAQLINQFFRPLDHLHSSDSVFINSGGSILFPLEQVARVKQNVQFLIIA